MVSYRKWAFNENCDIPKSTRNYKSKRKNGKNSNKIIIKENLPVQEDFEIDTHVENEKSVFNIESTITFETSISINNNGNLNEIENPLEVRMRIYIF